MHIPWNWIKNKVEIPSDFSPSILVHKLNYLGLECEENLDEKNEELFINFTVYSNRRDLRSWWGIAREISILLGVNYSLFDSKFPLKATFNNDFLIEIKTKKVFSCDFAKVEINDHIKKTPQKIVSWLEKNKIRLINPVVDIANFAMLETGQPFHIYDFDKIKSSSSNKLIVIHELNKAKNFIDIYGIERELSVGDIVISADKEIICLAGIIGDKKTSITNLTRKILIESSSFDNHSIKETSQRNKIHTKSSEIFSKNFNQEFSLKALERIVDIFHSNMEIKSEISLSTFSRENKKNKTIIEINHNIIEKKIGAIIEKIKVLEILKRLQFVYKSENNSYLVEIPDFRIDVVTEEDLIEEIGKIFDYNNLKGRLPIVNNSFVDKKSNFKHDLRKKISLYLNSSGYQEVISYSLIDKSPEQDSTFIKTTSSSLSHSVYRKSFLASHLKILKENLKHGSENVSIFEIGNIYNKNEELIVESEIISLLSFDLVKSNLYFLREEILKGLISNIFRILDINDYSFLSEKNDNEDLQEIFQILINESKVGFFGRVKENVLFKNEISKSKCFFAQLSIDKLLEISFQKPDKKFTLISYLPVIKKDISFIVNKNIRIDDIINLIKKNGGDFFCDVFLFDKYEKNTICDEHSLAFRLSFQGKEKNLYKKEVEKYIVTILNILKKEFLIKER
jgi:phenylalanyl-tRNA synthetase beta chain